MRQLLISKEKYFIIQSENTKPFKEELKNLGGKFNSIILSPIDIAKIIADHKQLMETKYSSNSMNFYLASNIYLLQAEVSYDKNCLILHYVLQTPMLFNDFA